MEKILEKFRSLPEKEHINKFMKYEKVNLKTQIYNKNIKMDQMLKQLNADPAQQAQKAIASEDKEGAEESQKIVIYGPKIKMQKEVREHQQESQLFLQHFNPIPATKLYDRSGIGSDMLINSNSQSLHNSGNLHVDQACL